MRDRRYPNLQALRPVLTNVSFRGALKTATGRKRRVAALLITVVAPFLGTDHDGISFNRKEITMEARLRFHHLEPWNRGKLVGQKAPFKLKEIWAIRVRLQMQLRMRERRCSILALTANSARATWSAYACAT